MTPTGLNPRRNGLRLPVPVLVALMVCACNGDFERMRDQPRYEPYGASTIFPDGKAMQQAPAGTVAVEAVEEAAPARFDLPTLQLGQERFNVYGSPCHGVLGNARTPVAAHMPLRQPPSLHEPRIVALSPQQIFTVVTTGYGFMPPYSSQLTTRERWAVVGYVRALQLSQSTSIDALPSDVQTEARAALEVTR
jgi:mono/diheme cytochrome c family protein